MQYPLTLNFKKIALAKQATLADSNSTPIAYARQKILKFKEELEVFEDKTKSKKVCSIKANKILDFRAAYSFIDLNENSFGSIKREGLRSIWKATYLLKDAKDNHYATIREENPFAKVVDTLLGGIIGVGLIDFSLRRAQNISWHKTNITQETRSKINSKSHTFYGLQGFRALENQRLPMSLKKNSMSLGSIRCFSMVTMFVMV